MSEKTLLDILAVKDEDATFLWPKNMNPAAVTPTVEDDTAIESTLLLPQTHEEKTLVDAHPKPKPAKTKSATKSSSDKTLVVPTKDQDFNENLSIQRVIGEGGVGRVYLAYDEAIGRRVAVKELLATQSEDKQLENSFIHEAKITGKLEHPGIIPVYQLGTREDGRAYYVMRYVKGETLEEQLAKCQGVTEAAFNKRMKLLDVLINACDALAYAHSKGVIHRDLKPSNIISGKFGETVILDWGLAQALDDGDDDFFLNVQSHQAHTYSDNENSRGMGTLRYMAPEQLRGKATKASDVYSLGVILFKLITGDLPYKGSTQEIQAYLLSDKPSPSPNSYIGTLSPELGAICEKAMAKNAYDRFADAEELSFQLKAYRDGRMVNVYSYSKQELFRRFLAKNKFSVMTLAFLFLIIVAGGIFSVQYAIQADQARDKAEASLISVTALGEQAQEQANLISDNIRNSVRQLFTELKETAGQLANAPADKQAKLLEDLRKRYPFFHSFTVESSSSLTFSGWTDTAQNFETPKMIRENGKLVLMFLVPVPKSGQQVEYLTARAFPEIALPHLFPSEVKSTHFRDIWIMKKDGLIFYDKEEQYRGTSIFSDMLNNQSPAVVAFGQLTVRKPNGVGYYSFPDNGKTIYKIAAWQTVNFPEDLKSWVIVVDYAYMERND